MTITLPQGFVVRGATMDDLAAVAGLLIACDKAYYGSSDFTQASIEEWIQSVWESPGFDLVRDSLVVIVPEGMCVGYVTVWHAEHAPEEMVAWPRVHPDYRGLGLGTYLLRRAEARAWECAAELPGGTRVVLMSWVQDVDEIAKRLVEREGFTLVRYFWHMKIEMQEPPPAPVWPPTISLRTFVPGQDERVTFEAIDEAFQDHWGYVTGNLDEWVYWEIKNSDFDASLWFLAMDGEEIAGVVHCRVDEGEQGSIGWISEVSVRRRWRRRGLAQALLYHSFGEFYQRGIHTCGLSVDGENETGATRLYERVGMHRDLKCDIRYEKELRR